MNEMDWITKGYCQQNKVATKTFFEVYEKGDRNVKRSVLGKCSLCDVKQTCYEYGVSNRLTGVYGGVWLEDGKEPRYGSLSRSYLEERRDERSRLKISA